MGSKVFVVEQRDRRVRIEQPIAGWCSLRSSNGDTILTPLDDSDAVPTTTPLAGQIRDGQTAAQENVSNKTEVAENLNTQLNENLQRLNNQDVNEITQELQRLKEEVRGAAQVNHDLMVAKQKVKQFGEEAADLEANRSNNQEEIDALRSAIEDKEAELRNKIEGNDDLIEVRSGLLQMQRQVEQANSDREAAQLEVSELRKEMQDMFFSQDVDRPAESLQNGDVVMLKNEMGIVVVRYFGPVEFAEGDHIGVELSDAFGNCNGTVEGVEYYQCPENFGQFFPTSEIKKKIMGEELLMKLQAAVKAVTQENTSRE